MPPRNCLRNQLKQAWKETIVDQYQKQLINSERGLQVYFCSALIKAFKETPRRIFVEPRLSIVEEEGVHYPDIVICNSNQIIGVVELKYLPRGLLNFEKHVKKDIETLEWIAKRQEKIKISNDRFLGPSNSTGPYSLAENAVLCWGGVYRGNEEKDISKHTTNFIRHFLGLHAVTSKSKFPPMRDKR